jgi:hypothetical protein
VSARLPVPTNTRSHMQVSQVQGCQWTEPHTHTCRSCECVHRWAWCSSSQSTTSFLPVDTHTHTHMQLQHTGLMRDTRPASCNCMCECMCVCPLHKTCVLYLKCLPVGRTICSYTVLMSVCVGGPGGLVPRAPPPSCRWSGPHVHTWSDTRPASCAFNAASG